MMRSYNAFRGSPTIRVNQALVYRAIRKQLSISNEAIDYLVIDYLKSCDTERFLWRDLRQRADIAFTWRIDKNLSTTGTSVLVSPPKSGKSSLIRWLLFCLLTGRDFLGYGVEPCDCVYYVAERSRKQPFRNSLRCLKPLKVRYPRSGNSISLVGSPSTRLFLKELEDYAAQGAKFFVIDPLFDALSVTSSNDYVEMNRALKSIRRVAQRNGVHILGVHHTNKGGENRDSATGILGSQAIRGSSDCNLWMRGAKAEPRKLSSENRYGGLLGGQNFDNVALSLLEDGSIRVDSEATARNEIFPKLRLVYCLLNLVIERHPEPVNRTMLKQTLSGTDAAKLEAADYAVELGLLAETKGAHGAKLITVPDHHTDNPPGLLNEFGQLCQQYDCSFDDFEHDPVS